MEIVNYKEIKRGHLIASFDVTMPEWDLGIHECKLFEKDGRKWIGFPSRQYEMNGEKKYFEYVIFGRESKAKFDAKCLSLLDSFGNSLTVVAPAVPF